MSVGDTGERVYQKNESDVYVVTLGRSGTMMMVNMLHQLRTGGTMDFANIERVGAHFVPITGLGSDLLLQNQPGAPPRIFWSHGMPFQLPAARKYVYMHRSPREVVRSFYYFTRQFFSIQADFSIEDFYFNCVRSHCFWPGNPLFNHVAQWWRVRKNCCSPGDPSSPSFLWLHFDYVIQNIIPTLETLKRFLDMPKMDNVDTHKLYALTRWKHVHRFPKRFGMTDLQHSAAMITNYCINNPAYTVEFNLVKSIRNSLPQDGIVPHVPDSVDNALRIGWRKIVYPVAGFETYEDLLKHDLDHITLEQGP